MANNDLGERLRQARERCNLTQSDVCDTIGIQKVQNLSAYETGRNNPPIEKLKQLAKLYKVSTDWLLFGDDFDFCGEKTTIDYILDLVNAVDKLGLEITIDETSCSYGTPSTIYRLTLGGSSFMDETAIPHKFLESWAKLRGLLDSHIFGRSEYDIIMDHRKAELCNGEYDELNNLPL